MSIQGIQALFGYNLHIDTQAALAFSRNRKRSGDVRPEMLLWYYANADEYTDIAVRQAAAAILLEDANHRIGASNDTLAQAAVDAIYQVRFPDKCIQAGIRARECGCRKEDFLALRRAGHTHLWRLIRGGLVRYLEAIYARELENGSLRHTEKKGSEETKRVPESATDAGERNPSHRRATRRIEYKRAA